MREPNGSQTLAALLTAASSHASVKPSDMKYGNDDVDKQLADERLQSKNFTVDGNCYFFALFVCLFGHERDHMELRQVMVRELSTAGSILASVIDTNDDIQNEVICTHSGAILS